MSAEEDIKDIGQRLARMEADVRNTKLYITNDLKQRLDKLEDRVENRFWWLIGVYITTLIGILAAVLKF